MKRLKRVRLFAAVMSAIVPLAFVSPASAYTIEVNEFDTGGTVYCGTKSSEPCLFWQEPHRTVITLNAYLDPSLNLGYYDFHPVLQNTTFPNYNTDPAYNPSFAVCTSSPYCGPIQYFADQPLACGAFAITYLSWNTAWYDSSRGEWNAYLKTAGGSQATFFSTAVTWNNTLYYAAKCFGTDQYTIADGRKVAGHETGHESSLGHTGHVALMAQGPENFYLLQSDDIAGLQWAYSGTYP
jgi:hypothetical protein